MSTTPARYETIQGMHLAGFNVSYAFQNMNDIPEQWDRLQPYIDTTPNQVGQRAYGVCHGMHAQGFDYFAGIAVSKTSDLPKALTPLHVPAGTYAVFLHLGPISAIRDTIDAAWSWSKSSGQQDMTRALHLEVYLEDWAPGKDGGVEVWMPVKS
ncbi:MAG: AraC family transcriptional regulator [Rhodospirillaceae bacterium]|nr:AraC family transcriptional regulator [Rhodospirillaceae bacterium]